MNLDKFEIDSIDTSPTINPFGICERDTRLLNHLKVLYLPPTPPSIAYRPWVADRYGFSLLRWCLTRLVKRYGTSSLVVACHDEFDRALAEEEASDLGVFVTRSEAKTLTGLLGELVAAIPASAIAWFHVEMMFAPTDLLERVASHHETEQNHFTYVSDLPDIIAPEIATPALLAAIAAIEYEGYVPSPREACSKLTRIRAKPFLVRSAYVVPDVRVVSRLRSADEADRARQTLEGLPDEYTFEAIDRWPSTAFNPASVELPLSPASDGRTRVLYLSPGSFYSGAEECLRGLIESLADLGFQQYAVVGMEGLLSQRLRRAGCTVAAVNWPFHGEGDANSRFARQVVAAVSPSVIHCNADPGPAFLEVARVADKPIVAHVRIATIPTAAGFYTSADHVIAVSNYARRRLMEAGVAAHRITVIYEGVDIERFSPEIFDKQTMRRHFSLPPEAFVILMVARPTVLKRHDLMLDAFASLSGENAHLVFVGDYGEPRVLSEIRRTITEKGLKAKVSWLPFQDDIRQIECAADVLALPSDQEALGMCVLEAMSLRIPVVVSDSGGSQELIENGISGLTISGGDAGSLASSLQELWHNPLLRRRLGESGRLRVERHFTLRAHANRVAELLRSLS